MAEFWVYTTETVQRTYYVIADTDVEAIQRVWEGMPGVQLEGENDIDFKLDDVSLAKP